MLITCLATLQVVAMTHNKLEQDNSLEQEVTRHWEEIMSQEYVFDRCDREVSDYYGKHVFIIW